MAISSDEPVSVISGNSLSREDAIAYEVVTPSLAGFIQSTHPNFASGKFISRSELDAFRRRHIEQILEEEYGELNTLEKEVAESLHQREFLARNIEEDLDETSTFGQRLADKIAVFGGSWVFISIFLTFLVGWVCLNSWALKKPAPDPYPFIFLNLLLSCVAALQAPVIMMSQNRQAYKDRKQAEQDYKINLKAEMEIRALHEKLDHLLLRHHQQILEIKNSEKSGGPR